MLSTTSLRKSALTGRGRFRTACELDPDKLTSIDKKQVVKEFLEANPIEKAPFEEFKAAVTKTGVDCLRIAALLKNSSFEEENEWRLVLPTLLDRPSPMKNPPRFRVGKTTLIPYIAHRLRSQRRRCPSSDMILGPGSDENSVFAARDSSIGWLRPQAADLKSPLPCVMSIAEKLYAEWPPS